jgi:hypothetical protein
MGLNRKSGTVLPAEGAERAKIKALAFCTQAGVDAFMPLIRTRDVIRSFESEEAALDWLRTTN